MTIAGHGKADDSPAAQAKFVDMYQDLNAQAQKKYANVGTSVPLTSTLKMLLLPTQLITSR